MFGAYFGKKEEVKDFHHGKIFNPSIFITFVTTITPNITIPPAIRYLI